MFDIDPNAASKAPTDYSIIDYSIVLLLALWGGFVRFLRKRMESAKSFNWKEFIAEMLTSALAGVLVYWGLELQGISGILNGIFCAMAGYSAGTTVKYFDKMLAAKFGLKKD